MPNEMNTGNLIPGTDYPIKDAREMATVILRGGYHPLQQINDKSEKPLTIRDAFASANLGPFLNSAVVEIMVETIEPLQVLTPLMDTVMWEGGTKDFYIPAMGVFKVERMAEGQAYPEKSIQVGGSMSTATIDKWGLAVAFTQEAIMYSRWDIVGAHVREAARAFARERETNVADHLRQMGQIVFDNRNPTGSLKGVTAGRDINLAPNGTMTLDDLFEMYAQILHTGYAPNLLVMHPLTWIMFIKDPILRAFAFQSGGGTLFGGYTGSAVNKNGGPALRQYLLATGQASAGIGQPANGEAPSTLEDFNRNLQSAPQLPTGLPFSMRIVVSPHMWFDPASKLTDIVMADASTLGALVIEEGLTTGDWVRPEDDVYKIKFRERYGLMVYEEGLGMAVAKNIYCGTNYWTGEPPRGTYDSAAIVPIDPTTPVV